MIAGALVGIAIIGLGIYVWYIYITTFVTSGNHSLFVLSLIQIGVGIYILFKASNSTDTETPEQDIPIEQYSSTFSSLLERNNALSHDWHKNADFKDKLTILKEAADNEGSPVTGV